MEFKTLVQDKKTGCLFFISREYPTKRQFIEDCRGNGFLVNRSRVATVAQYEWLMANTDGTDLDFQVMRRFKYAVPAEYKDFCRMKDRVMGVDC